MMTSQQLTLLIVALAGAGLLVGWLLVVVRDSGRRRRRAPAAPSAPERPPAEAELARLVSEGGNPEVRVTGALHVKGRTIVPDGFIVDGSLHVAPDSQLDALVEVRGNVTLGEKATVLRPMLVRGDLTIGRGASVPACHVEGDVILHQDAHVETTLTCRALYLEESAPTSPEKPTPS